MEMGKNSHSAFFAAIVAIVVCGQHEIAQAQESNFGPQLLMLAKSDSNDVAFAKQDGPFAEPGAALAKPDVAFAEQTGAFAEQDVTLAEQPGALAESDVALAEQPGAIAEPDSDSTKETRQVPNPAQTADLGIRRITDLSASVALPQGGIPLDRATMLHGNDASNDALFFARSWTPTQFQWEAPGLMHRPIYFEDVNLERYGNSACLPIQPVISGARFVTTFAFLPYKMAIERPFEPIYTLGYLRPGDPTPNLGYHPPLALDAAIIQAGVVAGAVLIIP